MATALTAGDFVARLEAHVSADELAKVQRYFKAGPGDYGEGCTCGASTGSTTGTWSTSGRRTWSAATCPTSPVTSSSTWPARRTYGERRTAMLSTLYFARQRDLDDIYRSAEILLHDDHDLIHKPVGGMLREAGKHDRARLLDFLDAHAATMPRTALRYAVEHLDDAQRARYRSLK